MPFPARVCSAAVPVAFPSGITPPTQGIRTNRFERIVPPAVRASLCWMSGRCCSRLHRLCVTQKKVVEETIDTLRKITIHHVDYNYGQTGSFSPWVLAEHAPCLYRAC
jgi:hypothetical protein